MILASCSLLCAALAASMPSAAPPDVAPNVAPPPQLLARDGAHDFDFLIGDWNAKVWRLPDRLVGSNRWLAYEGFSNHHKVFDTNANLEQFEATSVDGKAPPEARTLRAQTLRMYNPASHQWTIYTLDLDKGELDTPPQVGQFTGNRGEFLSQQDYKGRSIIIRFVWLDLGPRSARMEQSYSADGGRSWETNWVCLLSR
ncbi:MAG TPA: hypothetical protein VGF97_15270 [Rhizomicrobium sp.]|jgi:hypothetical protein